ncbi:NAD(P)/FAD-dependent oxidoreductase [Salisediminibacterium beveridgei]|uniref:FAD dependent oxidoreductase domain-containing protein n=1 Tax=Salisediminibacterium beveridgei TaxID=632773 RepID=A0A1D7QWU4_9BACI|nr:NAD(P)/FAD-dependent oxidoreductase [Salisediminibacterium beveridgei]AOM83487.1 hypothetical protein BBEV_2129 [Salisediminibacterium beveridgei]
MYRITVIGGGIVGTYIAMELAKQHKDVLLVEKEGELSQVQTIHNSALVHSPVMVPKKKGVLKAQLAWEGNRAYQEMAPKWHIPVFQNGGLLLAGNVDEEAMLERIIAEAKADGITAFERLSQKEIRKREPGLRPHIRSGLLLPSAFSADTTALTKAVAKEAVNRGAEIRRRSGVTAIETGNDGFTVYTEDGGQFQTTFLVNAAGLASETIASMVEHHVPYRSRAVKGEYLVLGRHAKDWFQHILYPIPTHETKGVLVIPQPDGTTRLGPTSTEIHRTDQAGMTVEGERLIKQEIERFIQPPYEHVVNKYAGVRSSLHEQDDFYIARSKECDNFIHVAGIDSPGVTAAPAIARYVSETLLAPVLKS